MPHLRLHLPKPGTLRPIDQFDPLRFYYKPIIGKIFRARIDMGLELLEGPFDRLLEIGYGSGLLIPTLSSISREVYGIDLEDEPAGLRLALKEQGVTPKDLIKSDIQKMPFPDQYFDCVIAFSILEHLKPAQLERGITEVARVLRAGGHFLVGCPAVHKVMNAAFAAIGFPDIGQHHFSGIPEVLEACSSKLRLVRRATMPRVLAPLLPLGWAPYAALLFKKDLVLSGTQ